MGVSLTNVSNLLTTESTGLPAADFVAQAGTVQTTFDRSLISGNVSWLVDTPDGRFFCKSAGNTEPPPGAPAPYFDHRGRVSLLRNAAALARSCNHPVLASLRAVVETATGPLLVYDVAPGELVNVPRSQRSDPSSAYRRFARAPAGVRLRIFDQLLDAHAALGDGGWVASDLYDGCMLVDDDRLTLIDLDTYHRGPFLNTMGRMFGSTTYMAPEEFNLGAVIDLRTTVYTLGRLIWHFGTGITEDAAEFCGTPAQADAVRQACATDQKDRWTDPAQFTTAWRSSALAK